MTTIRRLVFRSLTRLSTRLFTSQRSRILRSPKPILRQASPSLPIRSLSTAPPQLPQYPPPTLTFDIATGITSSTLLLVNHGMPNRGLKEISESSGSGDVTELVMKWQRMMETHLSAQVHVLTGLGYPPTEQGIAIYNQQLQQLMSSVLPDEADRLQRESRDLWRTTLGWAFGLPKPGEDGGKVAGEYEELGIQEAREIMYDVSVRMGSEDFLSVLRTEVRGLTDLKEKHTKMQELLIEMVYFGGMSDKADSLVERFDKEDETRGYIVLQALMALHQSDPLISQYVGGSMMKVFEAGGLSTEDIKNEASKQ